MKRWSRVFTAFVILAFLALLPALPGASAGGGTDVYVNNVWLSSASPYWKNGNAPASAGDWNAYYDNATSTLTLNDAEITDSYSSSGESLIYADGALNLVLGGASTITRTETVNPALYGVRALGALTVSGSGSLDIRINDTAAMSGLCGITSWDTIAINSGSLSVNVDGGVAHGIAAPNGVVIAGGETVMETNGYQQACLLYMDNAAFRMTGGKFSGSAISDNEASGIVAIGVVLTGGEGKFFAQSESFAVGIFNVDPVLYVSGGDFVFAGDDWAIVDFLPSGDVDLRLTNVRTYVSESVDSFAKRLWTSDADGRLVTIPFNFSPFLYVEFHGVGTAGIAPQTGDHSVPWLWAGIALLGLFGAAEFAVGRARKRREE